MMGDGLKFLRSNNNNERKAATTDEDEDFRETKNSHHNNNKSRFILHSTTTRKSDRTEIGGAEGAAAAPIRMDDDDDDDDVFGFWLVVAKLEETQEEETTSSSSTTTTSSSQYEVALVTSAAERDNYIACFQNSVTVTSHELTNLEELQEALSQLLPPPPSPVTSSNIIRSKFQADRTTESQENIQYNNRVHHFPPDLDEVKRFELFRTSIEHEDNLLNQRVSWLILAQSFLMAAFITTSGEEEEEEENSLGRRVGSHVGLRHVTAGVGLASVIVTMPAIMAAARNIEVLKNVYFQMIVSDERCQQLHGHTRDESYRAPHEISERRKHGHVLPTMAFRGNGAIPILQTVVAIGLVQFCGWVFLIVAFLLDW